MFILSISSGDKQLAPSPWAGRLALGLRVAACVAVAGALAAVLLQGWRARTSRNVTIEVDADASLGRLAPIWDEINLWKLQTFFGVQQGDPADWWGPGWLQQRAPWLDYGRVVAVLGGNYAPAIAPWCDRGERSPEHPEPSSSDCGQDGAPGTAAKNELAREVDGRIEVDYGPLRTALARLVRSGVKPHLNLSSAPAPFTSAPDFTHYHWNGAPIRDLDAWAAFVRGAFAAVADLGTSGWRVSIVNEANCLTLNEDGRVAHVGFAGTPEQYARIFVRGARAVRAAAPGAVIHAGNYVTSATFPGELNLASYLTPLRRELEADGELGWEDLAAVSLSLYETPDTSIYELVPLRVARLTAAERGSGLRPRPVKVDELGIHPLIERSFTARGGERLEATRFAASWHAEAVRALVDAGNVVSVAPWLGRVFDLPSLEPLPTARVFGFYGLLAGQLRAEPADDGLRFVRVADAAPLARLSVAEESAWRRSARGFLRQGDESLGALATGDPRLVRLLVVAHRNDPAPDGAPAQAERAWTARISAAGLAGAAYAVRHLSVGGPGGVVWQGKASSALGWHEDGCRQARAGRLVVEPGLRIEANSVWLFEIREDERCARKDAAGPEASS